MSEYFGYITVLLLVCGMIVAGFISRDDGYDYETAVTETDPIVPGADTLMALPLPVSPYPARPRETDFPAIGGMLERVRFSVYSDTAEAADDGDGYRFSSADARHITYELLITAPDTGAALPAVPIEAVWYGGDGTIRHRDSVLVAGSGWSYNLGGDAQIGRWAPGTYYLEILNQGQRVSMTVLEMVPGTTLGSIYGFPDLSVRVTDLRFYDDGRRGSDGGFLARTRFSSGDYIKLSSWIRFEHPPTATNLELPIQVIYFASDGRPVDTISTTGYVEAGDTTTSFSFPGTYARQWKRGTYRAEYFVSVTRIATGIFDVY